MTSFQRIDSVTATVRLWPGDNVQYQLLRSSSHPDTIFGTPTQWRSVGYVPTDEHAACDFGIVRQFDESFGIPYSSRLMYARINGQEYGTLVAVPHAGETPARVELFQNYPNPFNPSTRIKYALPSSGFVMLLVHDVLGQKLTAITSEQQSAGTHETVFDGSRLASGIYYYRLQTETGSLVRPMVLIK